MRLHKMCISIVLTFISSFLSESVFRNSSVTRVTSLKAEVTEKMIVKWDKASSHTELGQCDQNWSHGSDQGF